MPDLSSLAPHFAPWLTAVGAFAFGVLSHVRSKAKDKASADHAQLTELHAMYRNLVDDLRVQVDRLQLQNEALIAKVDRLQAEVERLRTV